MEFIWSKSRYFSPVFAWNIVRIFISLNRKNQLESIHFLEKIKNYFLLQPSPYMLKKTIVTFFRAKNSLGLPYIVNKIYNLSLLDKSEIWLLLKKVKTNHKLLKTNNLRPKTS